MPATGKLFAGFHESLNWQGKLPENISIINPYGNPEVIRVLRKFCSIFYNNRNQRILILGINPGRFGAGITGIPFTDPIALETRCGIPNSFEKKHELSSRFIYEMIFRLGGPENFYDHFILSAICPLGFLKGTKNYNYYDQPDLLKAAMEFIRISLLEQIRWNISPKVVFIFGKKNTEIFSRINNDLKLFETIKSLEHPRFIMQYRLRTKEVFLDTFEKLLKEAARKL